MNKKMKGSTVWTLTVGCVPVLRKGKEDDWDQSGNLRRCKEPGTPGLDVGLMWRMDRLSKNQELHSRHLPLCLQELFEENLGHCWSGTHQSSVALLLPGLLVQMLAD